MCKENLTALAAMSNRYGADADFVLAGGGNTSYKSDDRLWVKGSGTSLATIKAEDFVVLDRSALGKMWEITYPKEEKAREAAVLADMMAARVPGEDRRPSVETLLHDLFPQKFILHVHPALVNGLTCSVEGEAAMKRLLPDAVWVDACKPGYILAVACKEKMTQYREQTGKNCDILFLQNHGIFYAADSTEGIDVLAKRTMDTLAAVVRQPNMTPATGDVSKVETFSQAIKTAFNSDIHVLFTVCPELLAYDPATESLSPDHIVYAKAKQLSLPADADAEAVRSAVESFEAANGYKPRIVFVQGVGMFACGATEAEASTAQIVMLDAVKVVAYAKYFGGVQPMPAFLIDFIVNWEVESYRSKVSLDEKK